jgi:hypothetical protein
VTRQSHTCGQFRETEPSACTSAARPGISTCCHVDRCGPYRIVHIPSVRGGWRRRWGSPSRALAAVGPGADVGASAANEGHGCGCIAASGSGSGTGPVAAHSTTLVADGRPCPSRPLPLPHRAPVHRERADKVKGPPQSDGPLTATERRLKHLHVVDVWHGVPFIRCPSRCPSAVELLGFPVGCGVRVSAAAPAAAMEPRSTTSPNRLQPIVAWLG